MDHETEQDRASGGVYPRRPHRRDKPGGSLLLLVLSSFILHPSSFARADGGALRLSERQGRYRVSVFTSPTPLRAGTVDVSVFVQDPATGEPLPDATVTVRATPRGRPGETVECAATTETATNKLFKAAVFDLPEPGVWDVEVLVEGPRGPAAVRLEVEAAEPTPRWRTLWPWFGWPALVVVLFGVHRLLARRRR
jgi:hypothetical protein